MPTKKKSDELKKESDSKQHKLEQQLIDEYIFETKTSRSDLPSELSYVTQSYTLNELNNIRAKLNDIAIHITDIIVSRDELIDMTKPITITQFIMAGVLWHNWYLNQLEANIESQTWKSVYDMREFLISSEAFFGLFHAIKDDDVLYRTDLTDLAELTLRMLTYYYFDKCLLFDPILLFKQMLDFQAGIYMVSFFQEELIDEEEKKIASLVHEELLKKWREQQLFMFRSSGHQQFSNIPYVVRTMMYSHSPSISMNNLMKGLDEWMKMRLKHNMQQELLDSFS